MSSKIPSKILKKILKVVMSNDINNLYEFAEFRFDGKSRKLWQNGELIFLSPKASELLTLLLKRQGEFVSKEEIFETVWTDTFVEDGVLTQNIYTLRKALGTDADGLPLIENKTRFGYRLTVPVVCGSNHGAEIERRGNAGNQQDSLANNGNPDLHIASPRRKVVPASVLIAISVISISLIGFFGYRSIRPTIASYFRTPIETVKFTKLTNTGDVTNAALSPDGNFVAFVRREKVFLKDTVSNKEIPLEIPNAASFSSLQFSADGNFLYFYNNKNFASNSKIFKVSRFGGDTELVVERSNGSYSLSPDNKFIANYVPPAPGTDSTTRLFIKNLETKEEREILKLDDNALLCYSCAPAWSPDGKKLIHITQTSGNLLGHLYVVDVETGKNEEMKLLKLRRFQQAFWMPDGESFVVSATDGGGVFQLWKVYYPNGDIQPMTMGLSSYDKPLISSDGKKILTLQMTENANVFTANDTNLNEQKQLTTGNSSDFGQNALIWVNEQKILFTSRLEKDLANNFWLVDTDGRGKTQITNETANSPNSPASDGNVIYFSMTRNQISNISKIDANGGNLIALTNEMDGNRRSPQISPDGNWIYYIFRQQGRAKIMRRNLIDQTEEVVIDDEKVNPGLHLRISPDGKYLAFPNWRNRTAADNPKHNAEIVVISTETKSVVAFMPIERSGSSIGFSRDSKAIEFLASLDEGTQIMRQGFYETEPNPILRMPKDYIFNFAWSKSGKQLALSQGHVYKDAVLLTEFDK